MKQNSPSREFLSKWIYFLVGVESVLSSKTHKPNLFPSASHDAGASWCWLNADLKENVEVFRGHCCKDQLRGKDFLNRTQKVLIKQQDW